MKKLVLLDMDGTIYLGNKLFDCVPKVFKYMDDNNIKYMFLTNNSSKTKDVYVKKLEGMGLKCTENDFYTSIETTIKYLKDNNYKNIYVLGVKTFKDILRKEFNLVEKWEKGMKIDAVLASFDTELVYDELKDACLFLQDGADFLATNIDYRCPIEDGYYIPDCGGLCKWMELCTGKSAKFLGKPSSAMIDQVCEIYNVDKKDAIMVGDRYYTDIMAGINAGIDTLAVLTGETTKEEFEQAEKKPTYIEASIESLIDILSK